MFYCILNCLFEFDFLICFNLFFMQSHVKHFDMHLMYECYFQKVYDHLHLQLRVFPFFKCSNVHVFKHFDFFSMLTQKLRLNVHS